MLVCACSREVLGRGYMIRLLLGRRVGTVVLVLLVLLYALLLSFADVFSTGRSLIPIL